ncbi:MAG: anti-sigma factor [Acetobacteraceae bacterium]|nr:anti-sigma factor [Acetobacteraceae bacterium]
MSGASPLTPEERDALAGEYVLGTLDAAEAAAVRARLATDGALAAAVAGWEARLAPLQSLAPPEAPPPGLWDRIAASLGEAPARPAVTPRPFWRLWALGSTAVAAGLAAFLVLRPAPAPQLMTVLLTSPEQSAFLVEAGRDGALRLAAVNAPGPVPPDRVRQLWALAPGATAPVSLGLLPPEGRFTVAPGTIRPEPGMLIEITLEPSGGSPTGRPTGPILFIGRLAPARGT